MASHVSDEHETVRRVTPSTPSHLHTSPSELGRRTVTAVREREHATRVVRPGVVVHSVLKCRVRGPVYIVRALRALSFAIREAATEHRMVVRYFCNRLESFLTLDLNTVATRPPPAHRLGHRELLRLGGSDTVHKHRKHQRVHRQQRRRVHCQRRLSLGRARLRALHNLRHIAAIASVAAGQ